MAQKRRFSQEIVDGISEIPLAGGAKN